MGSNNGSTNDNFTFSNLTRQEFLRLAGLDSRLIWMGGCGELWQSKSVIAVDYWHHGFFRYYSLR